MLQIIGGIIGRTAMRLKPASRPTLSLRFSIEHFDASLPGLTRQSIAFRKMDARIKSAHDAC